MRTVQVADHIHAALVATKAKMGAKRLDQVVATLLQPVPRRDVVVTRIRRLGPGLRAMGARRIRLFGSVQQDNATPGSDIDLLLDLADGRTYFDAARIQGVLEDLLGGSVDLVLPGALHPRLRDQILATAEDIPLA